MFLAFLASAALGLHAQATPVSITESGTSGSSGTFTAMYTDPNGGADITAAVIYIMGGGVLPGSGSGWSGHQCILEVERASGGMYQVGDAGGAWLGTTTVGSQTVLSNSQCTYYANNTTIAVSGDTLTVTFSVVFNEGNFGGAKALYLSSEASNGTWSTNYQHEFASFTVPSATIPTTVSVTPSGQTGSSATFTATFSDALGGGNISSAELEVMNNVVPGMSQSWSGHECIMRYDPGTTDLYLVTDAGGAYSAPITKASGGVLSNSQCTFSASGTSATVSGNTLTVTFAVTFNTANFAGGKQLYLNVGNATGWSTNYQTQSGTWTVPGNTGGNVVISGQVLANGAGLSGVEVDLAGTSSATVTTGASGSFSFTVAAGGSYTVTPSSPRSTSYTFSPESYSFSDIVANVSAPFTATAVTDPSQSVYTISGQVLAVGYPLPGATITLTGSGLSMPITTLTGGTGGYSFTVAGAQTYTVTPSLSGYTFTPASRTYANLSANQAAASFSSVNGTKPTQPTSNFTVLVNGSFDESPSWENTTDPEYQAIAKTFPGTIAEYHWSGNNIFPPLYLDIYGGAGGLASLINAHTFAAGESLNVVTHSHGGNVLKIASYSINHSINNLVNLGTPQNWDLPGIYWPKIGNYCQVSSFVDWVQVSGASPYQVYNFAVSEYDVGFWLAQYEIDYDDGDYDAADDDLAEAAYYQELAVEWWLTAKIAIDSPDPINLLFASYSHSDLHTTPVWTQVVSDCFLP